MTKTVIEKMIVQETKNLSHETLNEILDFIQFLKAKQSDDISKASLPETKIDTHLSTMSNYSQTHLEEEFAHYKEKYPHE